VPPNEPGPAGGQVVEPATNVAPSRSRRRVLGVLVTYKRPRLLGLCLREIARQRQTPDLVVVVDNDSLRTGATVVSDWRASGLPVEYLPASDNLGPAGGYNLGFESLLRRADDDDLVVLFDDNDPIASPEVLAELTRFFEEMLTRDPATAGVGTRGSPFDYRRALAVPVPAERMHGPIGVDHLTGDGVPLYLAGALRQSGGFDPQLFFAFEELELGLRLRDAGHRLYVHGELASRIPNSRSSRERSHKPAVGLGPVTWRRYYSLRNLLCILIRHGERGSAIRVAVVRGVGKPIVNMPRSPGLALAHLRLNLRAIADAKAGRLGRTLEPEGY
jgi:GT2 family glycosyltransferase